MRAENGVKVDCFGNGFVFGMVCDPESWKCSSAHPAYPCPVPIGIGQWDLFDAEDNRTMICKQGSTPRRVPRWIDYFQDRRWELIPRLDVPSALVRFLSAPAPSCLTQ